jgi:hypothetical protein
LYDPGAVGDPSHQKHDFEPGIRPSGLFWTVRISPSSISFDTASGQARFQAHNVALRDYTNIINAVLGGGPKPIPSHVSFDVRWHGGGPHRRIRDQKFGFEGHYAEGSSTVHFTASNDSGSVVYRSDPAGQYNPPVKQGGAGSPAVGQQSNGVFFF